MAPTTARQIRTIALLGRDTTASTPIPQAPPAANSDRAANTNGWTPSAIIGIVVAIVIVLILVPILAVIYRRYERKRCAEMLPDSASSKAGSSRSSVREGQSLKSILVTKEVLRSSLRVEGGLRRPEEAHMDERGWSQTEVQGGDWR
jgi:H+/gluconate symporter-like permease